MDIFQLINFHIESSTLTLEHVQIMSSNRSSGHAGCLTLQFVTRYECWYDVHHRLCQISISWTLVPLIILMLWFC